MPAPVYVDPFVIRPAADLLTRQPHLRRASQQLARNFAHKRLVTDEALQRARRAINTPLRDDPWLPKDASGVAELNLGQWSLPALIAPDGARPLIDWNFAPQPPQRRLHNQTLDTVQLPPRFLGRRPELRTLGSRLRDGALHQLLITGPGGQGKTALAGKLAQDLAQRGYEVLAWSARPDNRWSDFQLELELLLTAENAERYSRMVERYADEADRAYLMLRLLMQQFGSRVVLFLDNLESLQDSTTQALTDERLAGWIAAAQRLTDRGLVLLLTSR